jgi:hypothetical protein
MAHSLTVDSLHVLWPSMSAITTVSGSVFPCTFGWRLSVRSQCSVQYVALRAAVAWRNTLLHGVALEMLNSASVCTKYEARERRSGGPLQADGLVHGIYPGPEQCSLAWVFKEIIR